MTYAPALAGFLASAGLIIAIGAQNAFVLRQGLQRRHVGLVVATCMLGDIALILCGVAGIGSLVTRWPWLVDALRYGGAVFLAAYGVLAAMRAWRGAGGLAPGDDRGGSRRRVLLTCLAFTFLNPHVYLDTVLLLGSLAARYPDEQRWVFAAGACAASVVWFTALGYGARVLLPVFRNPNAWRVLDGGIAVFMLSIAALLAFRPLV